MPDQSPIGQSQQINTSQPTVNSGFRTRSSKPVEVVVVKHPTDDKRTMRVNKSDYSEAEHGKPVLPKRAKKPAAKKAGAQEEEE